MAGDEKGAAEVNEKQEASGREIMSALTKRVLPVLQSVLVSHKPLCDTARQTQ